MLVKLGEMRNENRESSIATAIALNGIGMGLEQGLRTFAQTADPERAKDSLGTWMIDWHIQETKKLNLRYVYLGYWIKESPKMSYKSKFSGLQN